MMKAPHFAVLPSLVISMEKTQGNKGRENEILTRTHKPCHPENAYVSRDSIWLQLNYRSDILVAFPPTTAASDILINNTKFFVLLNSLSIVLCGNWTFFTPSVINNFPWP